MVALRENSFNDQKKTLKLEELIEKRDEEIAQLQKKLKRQDILNQPIFPCTSCTKNFQSAALLNNHILRKHPPTQVQESKDKDSNLINTIKLELEIKQLKEKLSSTERDLMDAKEMAVSAACEKCLHNSQRKFQSVAIQSNFEEKEKDDIEKDAICEILNNQMKHFEEWRNNEETRYRSEIHELRTKLEETIETLKQVAAQKEARAPSPAPRLSRVAEKSVGTSKSSESLAEQKAEETVWKARYEELEKMFEENQHMVSTVTSIEQTCNEKMSNIEKTVNQLKEERVKIHNEMMSQQVEKPEVPLSPKVIKQVYVHESSSSSDSDTDSDTEEEIQAHPVIPKPIHQAPQVEQKEPEKPKTFLQTFASQKFLIRPKKEKLRKPDPPIISTRVQAEILFENRLKDLRISPQSTRMTNSEFQRVHSELANAREESKKKNKSFYLTRKKLRSSVDKIFHQKHQNSDKRNDKAETSFSKTPHQTESKIPITLPVSIIAANSTPDQSFRVDLDRMLRSKLPASSLNTKPQFAANEAPSTLKKKVLFDLKEEDDSDFDLSSFASEVEEGNGRS